MSVQTCWDDRALSEGALGPGSCHSLDRWSSALDALQNCLMRFRSRLQDATHTKAGEAPGSSNVNDRVWLKGPQGVGLPDRSRRWHQLGKGGRETEAPGGAGITQRLGLKINFLGLYHVPDLLTHLVVPLPPPKSPQGTVCGRCSLLS